MPHLFCGVGLISIILATIIGTQSKAQEVLDCRKENASIELALDFLVTMEMAPNSVPCPTRVVKEDLQGLFWASDSGHRNPEVVAALFMPESGEILIDDKLDLSNAVDLSFLLHEYVHLHQTENGRHEEVDCLGVLEAEAYALQAAFLRKRGFPLEALMFDLVGQLQGGCAIKY